MVLINTFLLQSFKCYIIQCVMKLCRKAVIFQCVIMLIIFTGHHNKDKMHYMSVLDVTSDITRTVDKYKHVQEAIKK